MPLTRDKMDALVCEVPGCTHEQHALEPLVLTARCHESDRLQVLYFRGGLLAVVCPVCGELVTRLWVGNEPGTFVE